MRILVAPDKFKGSLGAAAVGANIAAGLRMAIPSAEITLLPMADGGEGTAEVISRARDGEWHTCEVHDPIGRVVCARYCTVANGATAVMETSEASGLWRVPPEDRCADRASSFGTGEMLRDAAKRGAEEIIVGLGGSATNDGGAGMARALGFRFLDEYGVAVGSKVSDLAKLARIVAPAQLRVPRIVAAADVRNPLLGRRGATCVFGMQKGVASEHTERFERAVEQLANIVAADLACDFRDHPGAGAAGGLGFGLLSFCSARIESGFDVVARAVDLEARMRAADVIITGEGRLDAQTLEGKVPAGVARLARRIGKKCYAIVGQLEESAEVRELFERIYVLAANDHGIENSAELLQNAARALASNLQLDRRA
ncbi:MAG: glycerate kinase, partial [Verrucomicrobiota bacterium]|nr:glycerate kinase [Verrucomicrobiota bacterium]